MGFQMTNELVKLDIYKDYEGKRLLKNQETKRKRIDFCIQYDG